MLEAFLSPTYVTQRLYYPPQKPCVSQRRTQPTCCDQDDSTDAQKRRRRSMTPEARAKISAALKGRRKSDEHRENLRRRFGGNQNPMYGRKLSAESRAKISRAMTARNRKKAEEERKKVIDQAVLDQLREKAKSSRLLESCKEVPKRPRRRLMDERSAKEIDKILDRVARLDEPPESVVKNVRNTEKRRDAMLNQQENGSVDEKHHKDGRLTCEACKGSGMAPCPECVGSFGVSSAKCETCFGAGATFCATCEGAGSVEWKNIH